MADAQLVLPPGFRVTDANDQPISGAKLKFYSAGTSSPATVYADAGLLTSLGATVTCDAGGYPTTDGSTKTLIYTGTASYKLVVTDAADAVLITHDNIKGALSIPPTATEAYPETPVLSRTSNYTVLTTDVGRLINANCTGGTFVITLPSAITAGDGFRIGIRHAGTANRVIIRTSSLQTMLIGGEATQGMTLQAQGHGVWLVSDGASGWTVDSETQPLISGQSPIISVLDKRADPPLSYNAGDRWIIDGTPAGTWNGFAEGDIVEANGIGGWISYTPQDGWLAWAGDDERISAWHDSQWNEWNNVEAPPASALGVGLFQQTEPDGSNGGGAALIGWQAAKINTTKYSTITGASVSLNQIVLPPGKYVAFATKILGGNASMSIRLRQTNPDASFFLFPGINTGATATGGDKLMSAQAAFSTLTNTGTVLSLEYYVETSVDAGDLGGPLAVTDIIETYASITVIKLDITQGPAGSTGAPGANGFDGGWAYQYSTSVGAAGMSTGQVRLNNAAAASTTALFLSDTNAAGGTMGPVLDLIDDSSSAIKGRIMVARRNSPGNFHVFKVTGGVVDHGAYHEVPVTYVHTTGTIPDAAECTVQFYATGDNGAIGTADSDDVTHTADGTGAVQRTVKDALDDYWISVKSFGAVGDGVTDDYAAIMAAFQAVPANGGTLYFPPGVYRHNTVIAFGDGSASQASTKQNFAIIGHMSGSHVPQEYTSSGTTRGGVVLKYMGTSVTTPSVTFEGPLVCHVEGLVIDANSLANGIEVSHCFNSTFRSITCVNWKTDGVNLSAYPNPVPGGIVIGCMDNTFEKIRVSDASSATNTAALIVGNSAAFTTAPGLDVARNRFTDCLFLCKNESGSSSVVLRYCDLNTFQNCFLYGQASSGSSPALSAPIRILPDMSSPGTSNTFPSGNVFMNCPTTGSVVISSDWLPSPNNNGNLWFLPHTGEQPGLADSPVFSARGGVFGFAQSGRWLDPQIGVSLGNLIDGVTRSVLHRSMTAVAVSNTTTETTIFTRQIPAYLLQNRFPTTYGVYTKDRQLKMRIKGRYVNSSGGSETVTFRAKYGATTIMSAPIAITSDANGRTVIIDVSLTARDDDAAKQFSDSEIRVFAPTATSGAATLVAAHYAAQHAGIAENSATALSMTCTVQHTTASASIFFTVDTCTLEML